MRFPASGALTRIQCCRLLAASTAIKLAMLADVQIRKESHQHLFHVVDSEVFVGQSSNQTFSPLLRQARCSRRHPAWNVVDRQQLLAPFSLELVAGIPCRLRHQCGTPVCSVCRSNRCATHVLQTLQTKCCLVKASRARRHNEECARELCSR